MCGIIVTYITFLFDCIHSTALYLLVPIENATGAVFWALFLGFILGILSIPFAVYMLFINRQFNIYHRLSMTDQSSMKLSTNYLKAFYNINKHKNQWLIWAVIIILFCGKGIVDTFSNETQVAYTQIYHMNEEIADICLSIAAVIGIVTGPPVGTLVDKTGAVSLALVIATGLMTLGIFMMGSNDSLNDNGVKIFGWLNIFGNVNHGGSTMPWIATIVYSLGLETFFISAYSSLFSVMPLELLSIGTSLVAILTYGSSMIGTYLFGVIAQYSNASVGMLFLSFWAFMSFGWAVFAHVDDGKNDQILRN